MMNIKWLSVCALTLIGLLDSAYLTYEHFAGVISPCSIHSISLIDCSGVLRSQYAVVFGVPVALFGLIFYLILLSTLLYARFSKNRFSARAVVLFSVLAVCASSYFLFIQFFVLKAICLFCLLSAAINFSIIILVFNTYPRAAKQIILAVLSFLYQHALKPILFKIDPTIVHNRFTHTGELLGSNSVLSACIAHTISIKPKNLEQTIHGIKFDSPIGLAAGFDYEARLTQILPALGFGFETVGTITYSAYEGNAPPMLGRLPKSRSLMVNKGFKNLGAQATLRRLSQLTFSIPVGISIGRTNSLSLKTQTESVEDIINTFTAFETSPLKHSYYELNISCPNLYGDISFYPPKNLEQLLKHVDELKIKRPLFIKMPIEKTNKEIMSMLDVIVKYHIAGVIFGNLQKNRQDPSLNPDEVAKFDKGAFSGKPTFNRSNELISLAYQYFGEKLTIIGCGGVFSTEDAYKKIKLGASLVQLITGMVYMGPTLIAQINDELSYLLENDGFKSLSSARGIEAKKTKF